MIMAESEGRGCDQKQEMGSPSAQSGENIKFKDPLLTGLDRDSDVNMYLYFKLVGVI